jgi:hypothetical protein
MRLGEVSIAAPVESIYPDVGYQGKVQRASVKKYVVPGPHGSGTT